MRATSSATEPQPKTIVKSPTPSPSTGASAPRWRPGERAVVEPTSVPQPARPGQTRVGWIGLGVMGAPMCGHLLDAGYAIVLTTRTRSRAEPLLSRGARWADTPRVVAEASDVVFSMVGFPSDVREVWLGGEGALAGCAPGALAIDMTTSEPALAIEVAEAAAGRGVWALDAPVSGGDVGAREARLSIMLGGDEAAANAAMPLFERLGRSVVRQGGPGAGQHAKLVNQILIASNMIGVCEALLYAARAGLEQERVLAAVSSGAAGSWSLSHLAPRILAGDFAPGFYVEHFVKDLAIALVESERMGLSLPGLGLARELYRELAQQGHGRAGSQALALAVARRSGLDWPPPEF
jgi:3-hydroxyisobutyrate dehydrogenase